MNDYEIGLEDRKTKKRWAGENYGWQSSETFNKLYTQGKLNPAQQAIDRVTSTVSSAIQQDPVMGSLLKFAGGAAKTVYQAIPQQIQKGIQWGLQQQQTAAENIAAATGLPVSITDPTVIAEAALGAPGAARGVAGLLKTVGKDLMTPPPSTAMSPAMALAGGGGSIKLQQMAPTDLSPTNMQITVGEKWRVPDIGVEGISKTPKIKQELQNRRMDIADIERRRQERIALGKSTSKLDAETYSTVSTGPTFTEDPIAYKRKAFKQLDPNAPGRSLDQHHLFAKGQSYVFVSKMDELIKRGVADEDDLVNMFAYAEKLNTAMGDRLSNILNVAAPAHTGPKGIHKELRAKGLEPKLKDIRQFLGDVQNADELMEKFNEWITSRVKPSKKLAQEIADTYNASLELFSPPERSAMEDFLEQLRLRGS